MFGVVGFTLYHNAALGMVLALAGALAAGFASMWIISKVFRSMLRLQSSGTVSLFAAVGSEGSVYLTVGKDGGRVQINFANRLREFEAVSADGTTIPTGTPIRVQSIAANTLVVAPVDR
jgi:membrane protein implicated in regulation of membrane protease activity